MEFPLIDNQRALAEACARIADSPWVALDTEFTRERTFYARLGLLQLATADFVACVDPLRVDLAPLLERLYDPRLLKVLHAGRQDLEVFHDLRGAVPGPVFDTQIAAALLGHSDQIGYGALVEAIVGVRLPKAYTRTNWEARPLTAEQLRYAHDDVWYLRDVYRALAERLEQRGRTAWLREECEALIDPALYRTDPAEAHRRLPGHALPPTAQPLLRALAAWRERTAQVENRPRGWIVADAALLEIARTAPVTIEALTRLPVSAGTVRRYGADILSVVQEARRHPPERIWPAPAPPSAREQELIRQLLARVKAVAEAHEISPTLLATRRSVMLLMTERSGPLARGWRRELIGAELLELIDAAAPYGDRTGNST